MHKAQIHKQKKIEKINVKKTNLKKTNHTKRTTILILCLAYCGQIVRDILVFSTVSKQLCARKKRRTKLEDFFFLKVFCKGPTSIFYNKHMGQIYQEVYLVKMCLLFSKFGQSLLENGQLSRLKFPHPLF